MSDIRKHDAAEGTYDFGDDEDMPLPGDPAFDAWLERVAPEVNVPPVTPRMEMWDAIQSAQAAPMAPPALVSPVVSIASRRRTTWIWPTAIAAALLLGVGIDRYMLTSPAPIQVATASATGASAAAGAAVATGSTGAVRSNDTPRSPSSSRVRAGTGAAVAATPNQAYADSTPSRLYRLAAVQTLTQAEALLTAYRSTDLSTRNPAAARQLGQWGREVLSSTRLLLDSPAGEDPQLRALLDDIELVLVQVIRLSGAAPDSTERALIDGAMRDHQLLPRIRTVVPAGNAGATD